MSHRQMHQNSIVTGKPVSYQTLVIDMAELSINQLTKQCKRPFHSKRQEKYE